MAKKAYSPDPKAETIKRIQRTRDSNRIDRENRMPLHPRPRRRSRERERE